MRNDNRPRPTKYAYSDDGETYTGEFDTIQEAAEEAAFHEDEDCTIYVGAMLPQTFTTHLDLEFILGDRHRENVYDAIGEPYSDIPTPSKEALQEVQAFLEKWATRHKLQPSYFGIGAVVEFEYTDGVLKRTEG